MVTPTERALGLCALLLVACAAAPPGIGGETLRGALVCASGALCLAQLRFDPGARALDRFAALLFLPVLCAAALQLVPWPRPLLEWLSPSVASLARIEEASRGASAGARRASADPITTLRALLLGGAYLGAFVCFRARRQRRVLTFAALALCCGVALWALIALAIRPPLAWAHRASGPFVNPNHLCAFLVLGLGLGLGLLGGRVRLQLRIAVACGAVLLVVAIVATRSRAGIVAALCCAGLALLGQGGGTRRRRTALGVGALALVAGLALSDAEPLRARFAERAGLSLSARAESWGLAWARVKTSPVLGEGLASFDLQSQALLDPETPRWTRPGSAHQDYLELAGDVGVPALLLSLAGLALALFVAAKRTRHSKGTPRSVRAGALGGLVGVLLHSAVDFPLQQPGVALLALLALALALGPARGRRLGRIARLAWAGLALLLCLAGAWLAWRGHLEASAREAFAKIRGVRAELRGEQARRVLPELRSATGLGARAEVSAWLGNALATRAMAIQADEPKEAAALFAEALEASRRAVETSPGVARFQLQLASFLLSSGSPEEVAARLGIALERGPTQPVILFGAAELALELRARTGDEAYVTLAERCLRRALLQRPEQGARARAILARYDARLGRRASLLRERLRALERAAAEGARAAGGAASPTPSPGGSK